MKRKVSFPGKTKLGVTFGKGKNANVVKTVADGGLFAEKGVEPGWVIVRVNRTSVDYRSATDALKKSMKRDGNVKLEFKTPVGSGPGSIKVMFDGKKKCGFRLEPKSTIVKSVDKRGAADKGGVQKGWNVLAVDGVKVNEENIRSELKRVSKSPRKFQVVFGTPQKKNRNKMLMSIQSSPGEHKDNDQELKAQEEAGQTPNAEAEEKANLEAEQKAIEAAEQKAKEEAERKAAEEAEQKEKEEAELRAREEAEKMAREEEEKLAQEEAEKKAKDEAEQKEREEAELRAREEADRIAKEEAEQRAKEEAEKRAKEEAEQKANEEAEQKAKEEAEQKAKEVAEQKEREEAERKVKEAEKKAQEEAEQKAREEAEQKVKEDLERKALEGAEQKAKDEAEMKLKEDADQKKCVDAEPVIDKDEEPKPNTESKPLDSEKVEEKAEASETSLPEAEVKSSVPQTQAEVESRPETIEDQPTAADGVGTAAAAPEILASEQKAKDIPKNDDNKETERETTVVKEETTMTECDVVEDVKQTEAAVPGVKDDAATKEKQPEEGEEASKETLPSAKDADESEVTTDAQPKAQTECKESLSDKPVEKDDIADNKMEPVAETEVAKSSIPIEEAEIKSQEPDQKGVDKLELGENDEIDSKPTEESNLPVAAAAPVASET